MRAHSRFKSLTLASIFAAVLFAGCNKGTDPRHDVDSDVHDCKENLRAIYKGLREYKDKFGNPPTGSGTAFFATLIASGIWEDTAENRAKLTCPGPGAQAVPDGVDYKNLEALTGADSAYAGRDQAAHPLAKFPTGGKEAILACDNAGGMNHEGVMNVLYADTTIRTFMLEQEVERKTISADADNITVGADSPIAELKLLRAD